jgi:hypothetical protein
MKAIITLQASRGLISFGCPWILGSQFVLLTHT